MPIFEKPPLETIPPVRERWTPLYLEHGRIEVDDASVKWIGADRMVMRIPVASISALMLGPGTTVTHAAMKACTVCGGRASSRAASSRKRRSGISPHGMPSASQRPSRGWSGLRRSGWPTGSSPDFPPDTGSGRSPDFPNAP